MSSRCSQGSLLIALEGADWERLNPLRDAGQLPNLAALIDQGVMGTMTCPQPLKPPLIWNTAVTGRYAGDHRILGDLVYENGQPRQALARHRRVPAIWEILDSQGIRTQICGHLTTHQSRLAHGCAVSEYFGGTGLVKTPAQLVEIISDANATEALSECWLHAEELGESGITTRVQVARIRLRLRQWTEALELFDGVLQEGKGHAEASLGRARCLLGLGDFEGATDAALTAIDCHYQNPYAHYVLGISLLRRGFEKKAESCFRVAITQNPYYRHAHIQLYRLKRRQKLPQEGLQAHAEAIQAAREYQKTRETLRKQAAQRQIERDEERQRQRQSAVRKLPPLPKTNAALIAMNHMVVCGLPRSGCSAVLQMLEAGGMPLMRDEGVVGIFAQWSKLDSLRDHPEVLTEAHGKVFRVNPLQVADLPRLHHYKFVYVKRPLLEVATSQQQWLKTRGESPRISLRESLRLLARQERIMEQLFRVAPNISFLTVNYPDICQEAEPIVDRIRDFLGDDLLSNKVAMMAAVQPALYRIRGENLSIDLPGYWPGLE